MLTMTMMETMTRNGGKWKKTWWGRQRWLLVAGLSLWCPVPRINEIIENLQRKSLIFLDFSKNFFHLDNTGDDVENPKAKFPKSTYHKIWCLFPFHSRHIFRAEQALQVSNTIIWFFHVQGRFKVDNIPSIHDWALINDGRAKNKSPILRRRAGWGFSPEVGLLQ